jgi:anti-sigma B factor antagonist
MKISIRSAGETRIVDVQGDIDLGTSPDLRRALFDGLVEAPKLVVNLAAIRYIDSSGIATLIEALKDSQRRNKEFVLFALSPAVEQVFHLTHVMRIFQVFKTEAEALGSA